ncbi:hypothetical protein Neosp_012618 [[Neocosmospora] mangrovei]
MVNLLTISPEIQRLICANLCRHCTGEPLDPNGPQQRQVSIFDGEEAFIMDKAKIRVAALSAMTLTCTTLRRIAQPHLYHYPSARAPAASKLLLRTLVERPNLAQYIDKLSVFDMKCWSLEDDLQTMLHVQWNRDSKEKLIQEHKRDCDYYHSPLKPGKRIKFVKTKYDFVTAFTAIVLPFGTSLQILHLELDEDRKFPSCKPGSLPRLKELVVKGGEEVDIAVIAPIFNAAPALERLGAYGLSCDDDWETTPRPPIHEGLKEIWLESCAIGPIGFPAFVGLFPRLEVFTYETNGEGFGEEEEASLQQIGEALLTCPDLRSLSIDFTKNHTGGEVWPAHEFGSISKLKKLQRFRVRKLCMFRNIDNVDGPSTEPPLVKIYDMLPTSITELEVTRPNSFIFDDMLELSGMATERFPLLKHVSIDGIEQEWEDDHSHRCSALMGLERINKLRQAFGQNGIEVSTGDFGKYVGWATLRA